MRKATGVNLTAILYVVSMSFAFNRNYADFALGYMHQVIIGSFWCSFALLKLCLNGLRFKGVYGTDYKWLIRMYLTPHIIIHIYTIALMTLGKVKFSYFTTNATVYVPTMVAIFSIYLFGLQALKLNGIALVVSWCISVLSSFLLKGVRIFPHAVIQAYIDPGYSLPGLNRNYLELHDIVMASAYVLLFYIFTKTRLSKRNVLLIALIFILMTLGMKRVSVLGIILALVFHITLRMFHEKRKYKICIIAGWSAVVLCYLYIYIQDNSSGFFALMNSLGVNVMGRNYYFRAAMDMVDFSPMHLGIGRNVLQEIFNTEFSYLRVGGVHSDIIKMYVENGFIMFGIWLWYYLIYLTKEFGKRFGIAEAVMYFSLTIYTFTLYTTDNVEVYFACQIFAILVPACYALDRKCKENGETDYCADKVQVMGGL